MKQRLQLQIINTQSDKVLFARILDPVDLTQVHLNELSSTFKVLYPRIPLEVRLQIFYSNEV